MNKNILKPTQTKHIDEYRFKIAMRADLYAEVVTIRFVDGEFERCDFNFTGIYTRSQWRVLAAIAQKISELEEELSSA